MSGRGVNQLFDARKWKAIFWVGFVKIFVVYKNVPLPIRLFDHNHVGHPFGVLGFSYEAGGEKFFNLVVYC